MLVRENGAVEEAKICAVRWLLSGVSSRTAITLMGW